MKQAPESMETNQGHPAAAMYFIGVTTSHSASLRMFPAWREVLGVGNGQLVGVDLPLNAAREDYRTVIRRIKDDPTILGALITSHKIGIYQSAADVFDVLTDDAGAVEEISCIYKRSPLGGPPQLIGHATDPSISGKAMLRFLRDDYWSGSGAELVCFGGGGAGASIVSYWLAKAPAPNRPARVTVVDCDPRQLRRLEGIASRAGWMGDLRLVENRDLSRNDQLLAVCPQRSVIVNATGMGKDLPGSPITDEAVFPEHAVVWELNYRGDLMFMRQAERQRNERDLSLHDGWGYFLLSWTTIVGLVFNVEITDDRFNRLSALADRFR